MTLFENLIKKVKGNSIVKWVYFSGVKKTGVTDVVYHGKQVKSLFVFGKELIPKYKCINTKICEGTLVYFKINRNSNYTIECINEWIKTVSLCRLQYVFVCDNDALKFDVLTQCALDDYFAGFLRSDRWGLRKVAKCLYTGNWEFATYAHLTPFFHAKSIGKKNYWCIDADDTLFLFEHDKCAKVLKKVEQLSNNQEVCANSLDMWRSKTLGKHWSLGVLYINDIVDFCKIFECVTSKQWMDELLYNDDSYNLDWFFTYLKDVKNYNIQSFYVENAGFVHWSNDLLTCNASSWINIWKEGKIEYPIIKYIYRSEQYGVLEIADCIKIDIGLDGNEYKKYIIKCSDYNRISTTRRSLLGIEMV